MYAYVQGGPVNWSDPEGLKVWKCKRPIGGKPGEKYPPFYNHRYNCISMPDGTEKCDSSSARPGWPKREGQGPGVPSDPSDDYYDKGACKEIDDDKDRCIEDCLENTWTKPRPFYDIGGGGTDCQEYSSDTFSDCKKRCS